MASSTKSTLKNVQRGLYSDGKKCLTLVRDTNYIKVQISVVVFFFVVIIFFAVLVIAVIDIEKSVDQIDPPPSPRV